jgi:hypothetical protein
MNKTARLLILVVSAILTLLLTVSVASAATVTETNVSPTAAHFPQNKQNESPMAANPVDASNAISGANDEIQESDCTPATGGSSSCPFSPTVQTTGVYVTKDGGSSWSKTILDWSSANLRSDGDPVVAFGPKPNGSGGFTYANGARAYFGSLAGVLGASFGSPQEFIAVAKSDDRGTTWSAPVVATSRTNPVDFNDKIAIWVDNNPSSPNFGFVYVSWTLFRGVGNFGESNTFSPEPIMFARSTDGGQTFENAKQLTARVDDSLGAQWRRVRLLGWCPESSERDPRHTFDRWWRQLHATIPRQLQKRCAITVPGRQFPHRQLSYGGHRCIGKSLRSVDEFHQRSQRRQTGKLDGQRSVVEREHRGGRDGAQCLLSGGRG